MKLGRTQWLIVIAATVLASCATERLHREGVRAIDSGQYEEGLRKLEQAVQEAPGNTTYRLDLMGRRERVLQILFAEADRARSAGAFADAERDYRRILGIEPGNSRAERDLELLKKDRQHQDIIAQAQREFDQGRLDEAEARLRAVLAENPGMAAASALRSKIDSARGPRSVTPRLKTKDNRPVTLQFRDASTKMVFEVLSRQTGINFIFDKDVKSDGRTTIFVQQVPVEQAIDLVIGQNQLARQILSDNMVLIYPNTAAKQKEYQDQIVRTFYLTNGDPKRAMEMLKTMLNAKTLFVEERAGAIVMRDTPEIVRMAERMLESIDVADAEVMMEVEVVEITRSRLQQLGIKYPEQVTLAPTPLAGDPLVLADLRDQDETTITVSPLSVTLDFKKEVGIANLLASPRIRARNHEKAKILIGQRVPVITNTVTPTTSVPVVTGTVQYVDVGLTLEVEPTVYLDNDVAIKVNLEVSNIIREITSSTSGTLAYQIGTRNATTTLRLKDGETQILAGLINDIDRSTSSHIPGLGDMPILGRLFGTHKDDTEKTEIVLSITPRIIRAQPRPSSDNLEFWFGTESSVRSAPLVAGAGAPTNESATGAASVIAPLVSGAGAPADGAAAGAAESASPTPAATPIARPTLSWDGPGQVNVGQEFNIVLRLASEAELSGVRSTVRFDAAVLELIAAEFGDLVGGGSAEPAPVIDQRSGRAQLQLSSTITGEGGLLSLRFKAVSPRPATMISVQQFAGSTADGRPIPAIAPRPLVVVVMP